MANLQPISASDYEQLFCNSLLFDFESYKDDIPSVSDFVKLLRKQPNRNWHSLHFAKQSEYKKRLLYFNMKNFHENPMIVFGLVENGLRNNFPWFLI